MWKIMKNAKFVKNCVSGKCGVLIGDKVQEMGGGGGGGFDVVIARDCDAFTATLVSGSYEAVYNKMISGAAPIVRCYMVGVLNDDSGERDYTVYNVHFIACEGAEDDRRIFFAIGDGTSRGFYLRPDNSVEYWEYND